MSRPDALTVVYCILRIHRILAVLVLSAGLALPGHAESGFWESGGESLTLYPKERQVAEGSALPMRLKALCDYTCPDGETSRRLEQENATGVIWRVNGIAGGSPDVGTIRPGPKDEHGRVTEITYIAPNYAPDGTVVDISATINHIGHEAQILYVAHVTILSAANWSGSVTVSFRGVLDVYGTGAADRNFDNEYTRSMPDRPYSSASLDAVRIDISWLDFTIYHAITHSAVDADDDAGEMAVLAGGISGDWHYYNRTQNLGQVRWSYAMASGEIQDLGESSRTIPYITAMKVPDRNGKFYLQGGTMLFVPGIPFEITGQEFTSYYNNDTGLITDIGPDTGSFGTVTAPLSDSDPAYGDACTETFTTEYDETVRFLGRDIPGKTTVSWCLNRG